MAHWSPNYELEIACKLGSIENVDRAIEEGADVNWDGGAPLFVAIMKGHRQLIYHLVACGADPGLFLTKAKLKTLNTPQELAQALCANCPPPVDDSGDEHALEEVAPEEDCYEESMAGP